MDVWEAFYGPNAGYAQELYERYLQDPQSVDADSRTFFQGIGQAGGERSVFVPHTEGATTLNGTRHTMPGPASDPDVPARDVQRIVHAARLARSIREYGHLAAHINPVGPAGVGDPMLDSSTHGLTQGDLEALPGTIVWPSDGAGTSCWEALQRLRQMYSGAVGYEFDQVNNYDERTWLHDQVESGNRTHLTKEQRRELLQLLSRVEAFERYLHTTFPGQKRFSIEGNDMLVPMLDLLTDRALAVGTTEILVGMAHRGRLNVLAHVLGKPYADILSKFQTLSTKPGVAGEAYEVTNPGWTGDVKYHVGGRRKLGSEAVHVEVTLADNPSHLEFVDPVVEGFARAAQDDRHVAGDPIQDVQRALAITIHGDAAFPGEGIVAETLNLSRLPGYATGGSIRFIVNNQIGFTTPANEGRSTLYASDLAKGFEIPVIHVNADVPEACLWAIDLAHAYRERFHKDVLIDLVGYRRWGHNEGDEPSFTQPQAYTTISTHPTVRALYARQLQDAGIVTEDEAQRMLDDARAVLQQARDKVDSGHVAELALPPMKERALEHVDTAVSETMLRSLHEDLLSFPDDFTINQKLRRVLERRRTALDTDGGIDWSLGETLAFASILTEGTPIRLTGQDVARGTFSQRHALLFDPNTGSTLTPLHHLSHGRASFGVYNSPLTEAATLGFEYGYTVHAEEALVLWEAQFGDFANAGQVIIDQFLTAGRAKWGSRPALILLLPHGYEGQGPEHSSGRPERYLQLAAEDNIRVANCTTPAQYFHLLRMQAAMLSGDRRPLVVLTPKSLLRHSRASSSLSDLTEGRFHTVLDDAQASQHADKVERIVFASGKVVVDLLTAADERQVNHVAIARVEMLYPFPESEIRDVIARYPRAHELVWLQEEPRNMGAWTYVEPRMRAILPEDLPLSYIGRPERASTAEGSAIAHTQEQARIMVEAFTVSNISNEKVRRGVQHVG